MQNFDFQLPTKIVFGKDVLGRTGTEIAPECRHVLLVSGQGSIHRNGVYDAVVRSLRQAGIRWTECQGISRNPTVSEVRGGVRLARQEKVDGILGVGGGSVVDAAKAMAAGAAGDADPWDYVTGTPLERALPTFAVITLAATGSELNGIGVLTNEKTNEKWPIKSPLLCPRVSIMDPATTFTVPSSYTAYGGVDAFSHVLEPYLVWPENNTPLQDRMAEAFARTMIDATEVCVREPENYDARATMMWGAALGWCGIMRTGTGDARLPNHMIEHTLSALYGVAHGAGLSAVIPGWAKYMVVTNQLGKLPRLARTVFDVEESDDKDAALAGISAFEDWCRRIDSPTRIGELDVPENDVQDIVANVHNTAIAWGMSDVYTPATIEDIVHRCF